MIVDSSAIVAILRQEEERAAFAKLIYNSKGNLAMSAATWLECAILIDSFKDSIKSRYFDEFIAKAGIEITPVTPTQAQIARQAYKDFGKGSGHPARLNFGDCFAYALAKEKSEPLLFKGRDFSETDVRVVATES